MTFLVYYLDPACERRAPRSGEQGPGNRSHNAVAALLLSPVLVIVCMAEPHGILEVCLSYYQKLQIFDMLTFHTVL